MRTTLISITLAMCSYTAIATANSGEWNLVHVDSTESQFQSIVTHSKQPLRLFAASLHAVYESADGGNSWKKLTRLPNNIIGAKLAIDDADSPAILLATDHGLYASFDGGKNWAFAFQSSSAEQARCTDVVFHPHNPQTALLATQNDLFISNDSGKSWRPIQVPAKTRDITHICVDIHDPELIYLLTKSRLYIGSLAAGQWRESFSIPADNEGYEDANLEDPAADDNPDTEQLTPHHLSAIAVDPKEPSVVYLAGHSGISRSADGGKSWQQVPQIGLGYGPFTKLLLEAHSPVVIYAATPYGIMRYKTKQGIWEPFSRGLYAARVNEIASTDKTLWAATDKGLFRYEIPPADFSDDEMPPTPKELLANFINEPTIAALKDAAIRYAEVHPDKIKLWRRQAALKALLPSVDFGFDRDDSHDYHVDEGSFPNFQLIRTKDRGFGVDISAKWDLGNLIWNSEQTSIDVRSKLMVQLREDIVDDVIRTYFERRRLQVKLLTKPRNENSASLEDEIRIQELTARLDGLTDGFFSAKMKIDAAGK